MKLSIGIIGLPNVGKSTLFNALLKKSPFAKATEGQANFAKIANYPFTTIDPNISVVEVPDERLPVLAKIVQTEKIVPAAVEFYDIAGLVKGASQGEGLGNKFLSHIREVAAIVHVVRLFEDGDIIHVSNIVDPASDMQTVETELILADLETVNKQSKNIRPNADSVAQKKQQLNNETMEQLKQELNKGIPARNIILTDEQKEIVKPLNLLTMKPVMYVFNVSEKQLGGLISQSQLLNQFNQLKQKTDLTDSNCLFLNAKLENDILALNETEQKEYLQQYNLEDTGLNRLIKKAYGMLGLISFLTAGIKEVRAWTIQKGTLAPQAAGTIHTDFEKHFIKADIIPYPEFVSANEWVKARELGKVLSAGRDYVMKDGDVVEFKIGAVST